MYYFFNEPTIITLLIQNGFNKFIKNLLFYKCIGNRRINYYCNKYCCYYFNNIFNKTNNNILNIIKIIVNSTSYDINIRSKVFIIERNNNNRIKKDMMSLLFYCVVEKYYNIVRYLIEDVNADCNTTNIYGITLLMYVIKRGSGEVCINGAAAHLVHEGDIVIILAYVTLMEEEIATHSPRLVQVDSANKIVNISRPSVIGMLIGY